MKYICTVMIRIKKFPQAIRRIHHIYSGNGENILANIRGKTWKSSDQHVLIIFSIGYYFSTLDEEISLDLIN